MEGGCKMSTEKSNHHNAGDRTELICIRCPLGCMLTATEKEDGTYSISGNSCNRGAEYALKELTSPARIVTTTVRVSGGSKLVVPVKTKEDIPKNKIMDCIRELKRIECKAPVQIGDVVVENVAGTGVSIVATASVAAAG